MPVAFDTTGMERHDERTWFDPRTGDQVSLTYIGLVPDIPAPLDDLPQLRRKLAEETAETGSIIEAHVVSLDGVPALFQLIKLPIPGQDTGLAFIAAFTVPRAECSVVLRIQCAEEQTTGLRESTVAAQVGFEHCFPPHPYAPHVHGQLPYSLADEAAWDQQFPDHPLTRARSWAHHMLATARIDPRFVALSPFHYPQADEPAPVHTAEATVHMRPVSLAEPPPPVEVAPQDPPEPDRHFGSEPRFQSEPEPWFQAEPTPQPEPWLHPEPVPEPTPQAEPWLRPEPTFQPEPAPQPDPQFHAEPLFGPEPAPQPAPLFGSESEFHSEPVAQSELLFGSETAPSEPTPQPEPSLHAKPSFQPEPVPQPEPRFRAEPSFLPDPVAQPEPLFRSEPTPPEPIPQPEPSLHAEPSFLPDPVPQPDPQFHSEPSLRPEPPLHTELQPAPVPLFRTETAPPEPTPQPDPQLHSEPSLRPEPAPHPEPEFSSEAPSHAEPQVEPRADLTLAQTEPTEVPEEEPAIPVESAETDSASPLDSWAAGSAPESTARHSAEPADADADEPVSTSARHSSGRRPAKAGDTLQTVLVGLPLAGYLPLWLEDGVTYWRMKDPDAVRARLGAGVESRSAVDTRRYREAAMFSASRGTLFLMDRFRDDSGHLGGTSTQLEPATEAEAYAAVDDRAISELYVWLGEVVLASVQRGEFVAVETGGWDVPLSPVLLIMLRTDGREWHSVVEASPVPVGAPVWRDQQPVDGNTQVLASPATDQTVRASGLLTRFAVSKWGVHPFQLGLSFGPNPTL